MSWAGLLVAFIAGWAACWYLSSFLMKKVLRRGDSMMMDTLAGLRQESLVRVYQAAWAELEKRRKGLE